MNKFPLLLFLFLLSFLASCNTSKEIAYMQDLTEKNSAIAAQSIRSIKIQAKDKLSIIVSSKNSELASLFNLQMASRQDNNNILSAAQPQLNLGYIVNSEGLIDFPIFGQLKVTGMTREELSEMIKQRIKSENYIQDPIVSVEFTNLKFSVLGEVKQPGTFSFAGERLTILEAIGMAQDLTIYGKRNNIVVVREENGERKSYTIDLRSSDFFDSPAYYLQQNDVVYVQPNSVRAGQSTINENSFKSVSLWTSLAALLTTIAVLIWK